MSLTWIKNKNVVIYFTFVNRTLLRIVIRLRRFIIAHRILKTSGNFSPSLSRHFHSPSQFRQNKLYPGIYRYISVRRTTVNCYGMSEGNFIGNTYTLRDTNLFRNDCLNMYENSIAKFYSQFYSLIRFELILRVPINLQ